MFKGKRHKITAIISARFVPFGELQVTGQNLNVNHITGSFDSGAFTLSEANGKRYINIIQNNSVSQQFEIRELTKSSMVWVRENFNEHYYDGSTMKPAAKALFYIKFTRK